MLSKLCQIEVEVTDITRARNFYETVFALKTLPAEMHRYYILEVPSDCPYGISLRLTDQVVPSQSVLLYFAVPTLEGIGARVELAQSGAIEGKRVIPGYGQAALVTDPDGHRFGLFSPAGQASHE